MLSIDGEEIKRKALEANTNRLSNIDSEEVKRCLGSRQALLEQLVDATNASRSIVEVIEKENS